MALGLKKKTKPAKPVVKEPASAPVPSLPSVKANTAPPYKFTARQAAFMDHWMVSRNATQAAIKAGYAKKAAKEAGYRTVTNAHVRAELDRRVAAQSTRLEVTADRVIEELAKIAFANMADYMRPQADGSPVLDFSALTRDQAAALGTITVEEFKDGRSDKREVRRTKFAMWDKPKALELLGRKFKLFGDVVEHDHKHSLSLIGLMLEQIDAESRGKVIEHQK